MFKKTKKKEEKEEKCSVNNVGAVAIRPSENLSGRRMSEKIVESTVIYSSTSSNSVRVTKTEVRSSIMNSSSPFKKGVSLFENNSTITGLKPPLGNKVFAIDATPFKVPNSTSNGEGYQSTFSRKLKPYSTSSTDAKPFNVNLQTPQRKASVQSPLVSRITNNNPLPRLSSYLPQASSSGLATASSTISLPTSSEQSQLNSIIPTYNTQGKNRGKMLVINNIKFLTAKEERKGAEIDERSMKTLFRNMGFEVETYRDLKKNAMLDRVNRFSKDTSLRKCDISIVALMSHGSNVDQNETIVGGGFTQIYGTDNVGLPIDDVLDRFSTDNCRAMAGKPKIFIFQCCRGAKEEKTLNIDASPIKKPVKKHADMLVAFSTLPGFFSIRDVKQGSWYIQGICDVFGRHAKEFDVETLLKIVDTQLSDKHPDYQQTSMYENRGFKRCFLNPKK